MNRRAATPSVSFILSVLLAAPVGAGPAEVLLDPHAGSADKYDAVKKLSEAGPAAIDAAPALARQSNYDQPHIRELALKTLVRLVGEREAERLRDQVGQDDRRIADEIAQRWLDSAKTWDQFPKAALFLHNARPEFQRAAAVAAIRIWDNTHTIPRKETGFDDEARRAYAAVLSKLMPVLSESGVRSATELTLALRKPEPEAPAGPEVLPAPEAVPTLLTALSSDDPKTRELARRAADQLFKPNFRDRETFARIIAGIVDVLVQPNPSTRLVAVAMDRLADMGEDAKAIAINSALYQVAMGNMRARLLLGSWNADRTRFAKAVIEQTADVPEYYRVRIGDLIQSLSVGPYEAAGVATRLLGDAHEPLSEHIATLIDAADPARIDRYAMLDATITSGTALSGNVLKLLNLDATKACNHIAPLLRIQQPTVRLAAVAALKMTGLKGTLIKPALEPLLDDPSDAVRLAAAEFLDRKEVIARIQVPSLLRELRSDNIERRMIAARQLDALGVEPKEITAALLRAVDRRDMPAREGLVAALEIAHAQRKTTLEMLAQAAGQEANSTSRVYARAALREVLAAR